VLNQSKGKVFVACAVTVLFLLVQTSFAQQRMSDRDIENIMKNLKNDSKRFESSFNSAISKSTIRNTSQEKTDKDLVKSFQDQTESMLNIFQDKRTADTTLPGVLGMVPQIDRLFVDVHLGGSAKSDWKKCKSELAILAEQFNMPMSKP
jgi:hypothetical protein